MTRALLLSALLAISTNAGAAEGELPEPLFGLDAAASVVGEPTGVKLEGKELDRVTQEIAVRIRCPVCQGASVGDSPSDTARKMKAQVRTLVERGFSEEQILRYFELSYGEFIRLEPKAEGVTLLVWIAPFVVLGLGAVVLVLALRKFNQGGPVKTAVTTGAPDRGQLPDDPRLAAAVRRVRELAYGWPGGSPPEKS